MAIIEEDDAEEIRKEFHGNMAGDVKLTLVGPDPEEPPAQDLTPQIRQLLSEVAALSPRISLEYLERPTAEQRAALAMDADESGPITFVSGAAKGKVRFLGAPAGEEFPTFIKTIVDVSRGSSHELSETGRSALAGVTKPVRIRVFFTPT